MYRFLLVAAIALLFTSCAEVAQKVNEEIEKSVTKTDSLADREDIDEEETTSDLSDDFKILKRKKEGADSIFLVADYYKDGKKSSETWYRGNQEDGLSTHFYKNGKVLSKLIWKEGRPYTSVEAFDSTGKPRDIGDLKNGDGRLKFYDRKTNKMISDIAYIDGIKNGDYRFYYKSGELKEKGVFKAGKIVGEACAYFKNGKLKERVFFLNDRPDGEHYVYYRSGKVKKYEKWQNGRPTKGAEYDLRGNMTEEGSLNSANEYLQTRYDYSPEGKMRSRCRYKNSMKNGLFEYYGDNYRRALEIWRNDTLLREYAWYSNEQLKSTAVYHGNEKDSIYTEYYSTGKLRLQVGYKKGQRDGIYISYFDNGNKFVEGAYTKGRPAGKFKHYTKEGKYNGSYTSQE